MIDLSNIAITDIALQYGYAIDKERSSRNGLVLVNEAMNDRIVIWHAFDPDKSAERYFTPGSQTDKGGPYLFILHKTKKGILPNGSPVNATDYELVRSFVSRFKPEASLQSSRPEINHARHHRNQEKIQYGKFLVPIHDFSELERRQIPPKICESPLFKNRIFNTELNYSGIRAVKLAFPIYDRRDSVVGIEQRDSASKRFMTGSMKGTGVWHSNMDGKIDTVVMCESAIDCICHHLIHNNNNALYVATCGNVCTGQIDTVTAIVKDLLERNPLTLLLAFDNDAAGRNYDELLMQSGLTRLHGVTTKVQKSKGKDFGDDWINRTRNANAIHM